MEDPCELVFENLFRGTRYRLNPKFGLGPEPSFDCTKEDDLNGQ
ncbi:hypothetical protein M7I_5476 [Glarea lozoyensis 74030]|uniref:Uncharacterized protein n=1 Tax=Glarea lozoyensis (strain ATCC 74030 / MF5533) TaxID=1104152 RepID=H0ES03_GLAL7|nr:hypothetical protein M7I_5476 [Glarea lozoyensis 74030]